MTTVLPALLNNEQAAAAIGVTPKTLRFWRHKGKGPRYIKYGPEQHAGCAYDPADIQAWLDARKFTSTSAVSAAARSPARKPPATVQVQTLPWRSATV